MSVVHGVKLVLVGFTELKQLGVPELVELLVLLDMRLLTLRSLFLVVESHLLHLALEVLLLEFGHSVLGHLSLNVAAFLLALLSELLSSLNKLSDVLSIHLVVLTVVGRVLQVL